MLVPRVIDADSRHKPWIMFGVVAFVLAGLLIAILIGRRKRVKRLDVGGGAEAGERDRLISAPSQTPRDTSV